jgi:hypothetical protein
MAGTVTTTEDMVGALHKVKFDWTSDAAGAADGVTTARVSGAIMQAVFDPASAASQPTDAYDVVITDIDGVDVLNGLGANLSNAANVVKRGTDGLLYTKSSLLTLAVTNAGDTKSGAIILYIINLENHY